MNNYNIMKYPSAIVVLIFLVYYCLYDLTSVQCAIPSQVSNLIVLLAMILATAIGLCYNSSRLLSGLAKYWLPFFFVLVVNIVQYDFEKSYVFLFAAFLTILSSRIPLFTYEKVIKWIKILGILGAIGVAIQLFLPSIHKTIISIIFSGEGLRYIFSYADRGYYSGFFHQVGDTAYYVAAAIIAMIFRMDKNRKNYIILALMFLSLILLGKRSILLFLFFALLLTYMLNGSNSKIISRLTVVTFSLICFFFIMSTLISMYGDIKLFEKMSYTLAYLGSGDIEGLMEESGRLNLRELALDLFEKNQIIGIGWSNFSKISGELYASGVGTSVHNIYLQLLCETGIIGLSAFIIGVVASLLATLKTRHTLRNRGIGADSNLGKFWSISFTGQVLFLTFGFVENPLYNANCLLFYMLVILMNVAIKHHLKNSLNVVLTNK